MWQIIEKRKLTHPLLQPREQLSDAEFHELYKEYKILKAEYPGIIPFNKVSVALRRAMIASDFNDRLREEEERLHEKQEK